MTPGSGTPLNYGFDASGNLTTLPTGATGSYDNAGELTCSTLVRHHHQLHLRRRRPAARRQAGHHLDRLWHLERRRATHQPTPTAPAAMTAATYDGNGLRRHRTTPGAAPPQNFTWDTSDARRSADGLRQRLHLRHRRQPPPSRSTSPRAPSRTWSPTRSARCAASSARTGALTGTTSYDAWGNPQTPGGLTATPHSATPAATPTRPASSTSSTATTTRKRPVHLRRPLSRRRPC